MRREFFGGNELRANFFESKPFMKPFLRGQSG